MLLLLLPCEDTCRRFNGISNFRCGCACMFVLASGFRRGIASGDVKVVCPVFVFGQQVVFCPEVVPQLQKQDSRFSPHSW